MHIGVDLDGVLGDILEVTVRHLNGHFAKELKVDDVWDYDLSKVYAVPQEEVAAYYSANPQMLMEPKPMPGAVTALRRLAGGHRLTVITARDESQRGLTERWLQGHGLVYHRLVMVGNHDKRQSCRENKIDLFIEDRKANALNLAELGIPVILLAAPHNGGELPPGTVRLKSWPEILAWLEGRISCAGS